MIKLTLLAIAAIAAIVVLLKLILRKGASRVDTYPRVFFGTNGFEEYIEVISRHEIGEAQAMSLAGKALEGSGWKLTGKVIVAMKRAGGDYWYVLKLEPR